MQLLSRFRRSRRVITAVAVPEKLILIATLTQICIIHIHSLISFVRLRRERIVLSRIRAPRWPMRSRACWRFAFPLRESSRRGNKPSRIFAVPVAWRRADSPSPMTGFLPRRNALSANFWVSNTVGDGVLFATRADNVLSFARIILSGECTR